MHGTEKPRLYHNPSSYYSMIARLALHEGGIDYEPVFVDIHARMSQQQPDYVRLNPNMTVPTLVLPGRTLDQSRDIAEYALGVSDNSLDAETKFWLDLHYAYPIEELTFGRILSRNPMARFMIPKLLAASHRRLAARAIAYPDLAGIYKARAAVFAERARTFEPDAVLHLAEIRQTEAIGFLDRLERQLADGRGVIVAPLYGVADVVWTVFLARMEFTDLGAEIAKRPLLASYWRAMQERPSFAAADIWTRMHLLRMLGAILGIGRH
jgi:tetrachloro-p-hydroquinone reductive dehalogenase